MVIQIVFLWNNLQTENFCGVFGYFFKLLHSQSQEKKLFGTFLCFAWRPLKPTPLLNFQEKNKGVFFPLFRQFGGWGGFNPSEHYP